MLMRDNTQMVLKYSKNQISFFESHVFFWEEKVVLFGLMVKKELVSKPLAQIKAMPLNRINSH